MTTPHSAGRALLQAVQAVAHRQACAVQVPHDAGRAQAADAAGALLDALRQAFGDALCDAVADEFDLHPAPGHRVTARATDQAREAACAARQALSGTDFLTLLNHSAAASGADYRRTAWQMGLDPQQIEAATRRQVDEGVRRRFEAHGDKGQALLPQATVNQWLKMELFVLTK